MRRIYTILILLFVGITFSYGQRKVSGKVISTGDKLGLPGVTVMVKGQSVGTITDFDGNYSLDIPESAEILVFSFIGMQTQEIALSGQSQINVSMVEETELLEDVIVTAIGIKVEKKSIGYAAQEVKGDDISNSQEANIVNALSSKVAGVEVTSSSGSPGASSAIVIRGRTSLRGKNSPLFVIDGVPMDNSYSGTAQVDYSNRAIDLNSDDIESVTVLKGASAAALYGIRAANGAIVITTKSGKSKTGVTKRITVKSSLSIDLINKLPEKQSKYAQGSGGFYDDNANASWGPLIDTLRYDGATDYLKNPNGRIVSMNDPSATDQLINIYNNAADFFQPAIKQNTYLSMSGNNDAGSYFFSTGHLNQNGIIPNSDFKRTTVKISGESKLTDKLRISGSANYSNSGGNRAQKGSNLSAVMVGLMRVTPTFDISNGASNPANDESAYIFPDGTPRNYYSGYDNPYWSINKNIAQDEVNRIIGNSQIDYEIFPWLSALYRVGIDFYSDKRLSYLDNQSSDRTNGLMTNDIVNQRTLNSDFLLTAEKNINDNLKLTVIGGHNYYTDYRYSLYGEGDNFILDDFYDLSNTETVTSDDYTSRYKIVGAFYDIKFAYKSFLYFNTTGRNDWSSTISKSFFYPSVNVGFIFSDAFDFGIPAFNYGKIRASYAGVGNDAPTYSRENYFSGLADRIQGNTAFATQRTMGNINLEPENTSSSEIGLDLRFFNNKIGLDMAFYTSKSIGQIIEVPVAYSTGYTTFFDNAGIVSNKGIELQFFATPVETKNFSWDIMLNYSKNKNLVEELDDRVSLLEFDNTGLSSTRSVAIEGQPYGILYGQKFLRNDNGDILVNDEGYPLVDPVGGIVGDPNPDWIGNIRNTLTYKGLSVSALIDIKQGGDVYNGTRGAMSYLGVHKDTENRDEDFVFEGVNENTGLANDVVIKKDASFYSRIGKLAGNSEYFLEDGSYIRLREVGLSYNLPDKWLEKTPINTLNMGVSARNLLLITNYSGIDPETNLSGVSNSLGRDYFNNPNTKSFEFSIQLTF